MKALDDWLDEARALDFRAAIRLADCARPGRPALGEALHPRDESIRLSQHVSQAFRGTALERLTRGTGSHEYRLYCNFFGLLGSNGPLPLHFTEYADQRARHQADPTFREFLDLFNHRLLSLFYRASVQFDPVINHDRIERDEYRRFIGALIGCMHPASLGRSTLPDNLRRSQVGWFSARTRCPDGIEQLLGDWFDLPVRVVEFVGGWMRLPDNALARLGGRDPASALGVACYAGRTVWSIAHRFRIVLGPLSWADYQSFKPGSDRARNLYDLVQGYVGEEWDWDVELQVAEGRVNALALDHSSALGFDCWLSGSRSRDLEQQSVTVDRQWLIEEAEAA